MDWSKKKKLTKIDEEKILARYEVKLAEYKTKSMDELKIIYNSKISNTDRQACVVATNFVMKNVMMSQHKELNPVITSDEGVTEGINEGVNVKEERE